MQFTHEQYDALERAMMDRRRIAVVRRGAELVIVPRKLHIIAGREVLEASHPTTGDTIEVRLDDVEGFEVLR